MSPTSSVYLFPPFHSRCAAPLKFAGMSDFANSVQFFSEKAHRAAAQARETLALLSGKPSKDGITASQLKVLRDNKNMVLIHWIKVVRGTVSGPTLFGDRQQWSRLFSELYEALMDTISSKANPPNDAGLVSFCTRLVAQNAGACTDDVMQNTRDVLWLFEDVAPLALNPLQSHASGPVVSTEVCGVGRRWRVIEGCGQGCAECLAHRTGGRSEGKKSLCTSNGPLSFGSLFKISFFLRGRCFWFWVGGWFGLGGWVRQTTPAPPWKHISDCGGLCRFSEWILEGAVEFHGCVAGGRGL